MNSLLRKLGAAVFCALALLMVVPSQARAGVNQADATFDDLAGKTAGVMTGTPQETMVTSNVEDAQIEYFNNFTDIALALQQDKIDFFVNSTIAFRILQDSYPDFAYVDQQFCHFDMGAIFPKTDEGQALCDEFNEYIAEITANGKLDELKDYWLYPNDWENFEIPTTGENGVLHMVASSSMKPFCFMLNNQFAGFDIAVVAGFCEEYGYGLEIDDTDLGGCVSGIAAGKYDLSAGQLSWTEERAESVLYSDLYCGQDMVPIVRAADYPAVQEDASDEAETEANSDSSTSKEARQVVATFDDLEGKIAGVMTGTPQETMVTSNVKDAQIEYFNNFTDIALALQQNKIDFFVNSTIAFRILQDSYPDFAYVNQQFCHFDMGAIFPKTDEGQALCDEFNEYIAEITANGKLDELKNYWLYPNDWENFEIPATGENGVLHMVASSSMKPFSFNLNGEFAGFDIAVVAGFCEEHGYGLEIDDADLGGCVSGIAAGKYDLSAGQLSWTEERAESVLYSDLYCGQDMVPIVRAADYPSADEAVDGSDNNGSDSQKVSIWATIQNSFRRTLLDEDRYKLIFSGLWTTLVITFAGFLLANLFGMLFCSMALSKSRFLHALALIYSGIMQGTPMVVILMILYYIVFGHSRLSGVCIASIGFGITSGAYLAQLFEGAIRGIDRGQWEAALAIGFTKSEAFFHIILPQAIRGMLPGYFSQLISLMKGTAIVGYIAVADLTKSGDIIRSSTFQPFFPLIVIALIYLAIACLLIAVMRMIQRKLAPKRRQAAPVDRNGGEQ